MNGDGVHWPFVRPGTAQGQDDVGFQRPIKMNARGQVIVGLADVDLDALLSIERLARDGGEGARPRIAAIVAELLARYR